MKPIQHLDFNRLHERGLIGLGMVMAHQMQCTVHHEQRQFVDEILWRLCRYRWTDHNVAKHGRLAFGHRCGRSNSINWERQYVGWPCPTHVLDVKRRHLIDLNEGKPNLAGMLWTLGSEHVGQQLTERLDMYRVRLLAVVGVDLHSHVVSGFLFL